MADDWDPETWTQWTIEVAQVKVHHRPFSLKMARWCIRQAHLTLVCEVIRYHLVQVWQNLKKKKKKHWWSARHDSSLPSACGWQYQYAHHEFHDYMLTFTSGKLFKITRTNAVSSCDKVQAVPLSSSCPLIFKLSFSSPMLRVSGRAVGADKTVFHISWTCDWPLIAGKGKIDSATAWHHRHGETAELVARIPT